MKRSENERAMTKDALSIVDQAIQAVDPYTAIKRHISMDESGRTILVKGSTPKEYDLSSFDGITLVAFGKEGEEVDLEMPSTLQVDWAIPMANGYAPGFAIASARLSEKRSWSHGRDPSPEMALKKAISETKEWTSCGCIPELTCATYR